MHPMPHPPKITTVAVPPGSAIASALPGAYFADSYEATDPEPAGSALQAWLSTLAHVPGWTNRLMALRNRLVRLAGLKDLGALGGDAAHPLRDAASYRVGDRVGIFRIRHLAEDEVVMGQDDRHLDVQVSLTKRQPAEGPPRIALSTVVHVHNTLGRVYMALVVPFHRRIVRTLLARYAAR